MKIVGLTFLSLFGLFSFTGAQVQFVNRNDLLQNADIHSAVPVGVADMNGDGLDDIISLDDGKNLVIQYQTPDPARPFVYYRLPVFIDNNEQNDICIADFNNDGANDILTVGSYDRVKVLYSEPHTFGYMLTHIVVTPFFSQGASSGDFNLDGWVDVVMLNDNGLNYTLLNDGTGNLVLGDLFDFVTVPASDNSGNYGSVYTDFDMDGDLDFYIAKCRQGVNNPTDPRRINVLFVNDGSGNYTQDALRYGLASGRQTWTADFGDMDNDGDLDCFMTQHDVISELYENIDNDTFINITSSTGLNIGGIPLQGMFRDFDNDGFQDILVSGDRLDYYHNNGDKTFTKINPFGGNGIFGTFGLGDFNQDGFTDVYASRVIPFNNPDPLREDILFLNEKNDNHFLALQLTDTVGNPSAIGAMAMLYGPWGIQVREVRGGEQYGVSNSHAMIFGIGQHTGYDSLVIRWPNGGRELYNGLEIDRTWSIRRGGCVSLPLPELAPLTVLCEEDSVILSVTGTLPLIGWSNGGVSDTISVNEPGIFYATMLDTNGCLVRTTPMEVSLDPDTVMPVLVFDGKTFICDGDEVQLSVSAALGYAWSNGDTTQQITATTSGAYYALVEGYCKMISSDTVVLSFLTPDAPVTTSDTFILGESALLIAAGDSIQWFADPEGTVWLGAGPEIQLDDLTDTTTVYARNLEVIPGLDYQVGPTTQQGTTKYNATFVNGGLLFDVLEPVILHQVTMFTDSAGIRQIDILENDVTVFSKEIMLDSGMTVVDLDAALAAGSYTIMPNEAVNNQSFGVNSPYLWRSSDGVLYPYDVSGVLSITNSTLGANFYYYFYDWKISTPDTYCASALVPATAFLEIETGVRYPGFEESGFTVAPNPTSGILTLTSENKLDVNLYMIGTNGAVCWSQHNISMQSGSVEMDHSTLPPGVYFLKVVSGAESYIKKIIRL